MLDRDAEWILNIISMHEKISRKALAYNIGRMLDKHEYPKRGRNGYLGKLCGLERETLHSWLGPDREAKMPLKMVAILCVRLGFSLTEVLKPPPDEDSIILRVYPKRSDSYENEVVSMYKENPDIAVSEIAERLNITEVTVRRHLKNYKEKMATSDSNFNERDN